MMLFLVLMIFIQNSNIVASLFCDEPYSCNASDLFNLTEFVHGAGYKSIYDDNIQLKTTSGINCEGESACSKVDSVQSGNYILCRGQSSCSNVQDNLYVDWNSLQCVGLNSCANSVLQAQGTILACAGVYSCVNSTVSQTKVTVGIGPYSLSNSVIYSVNNSKITLWGYYSGYNLTISLILLYVYFYFCFFHHYHAYYRY